jgi:hypothetical protein
MEQAPYDALRRHAEALAFWEDAALPDIGSEPWHLPPKAFIETFRKCGWLSESEMTQLAPRHAIRFAGVRQGSLWEKVSFDAKTILRANKTPINKMLRKYGINTPTRMACFFGNAIQETQWLSTSKKAAEVDYGTPLGLVGASCSLPILATTLITGNTEADTYPLAFEIYWFALTRPSTHSRVLSGETQRLKIDTFHSSRRTWSGGGVKLMDIRGTLAKLIFHRQTVQVITGHPAAWRPMQISNTRWKESVSVRTSV